VTSQPDFEFFTLGAPQLRDSRGHDLLEVQAQPKRLALLAYLASGAENRPKRRDVVVAHFWPELDDQHARGALRQALSYLRRALNSRVVVTNGDDVGIDTDRLALDAHRFETAFRAGRFDEAMELYRGDYLEGLYVADASPELQQWLDSERTRLRVMASDAAWQLANAAAERHETRAARAWANRAAALAPHDEGELRRIIALLDQIGDRAAAVRTYEQFADDLQREYGVAPSPETQQLINQVRGRVLPLSTPAPPAAVANTFDEQAAPKPQRSMSAEARRRRWILAMAGVTGGLALTGYVLVLAGSKPQTEVAGVPAAGQQVVFAKAAIADSNALDAYTRGRQWWSRRNRDALLKSISYYQRALDAEPTFALAYSGMGASYVQLGYGSLVRPDDAFPKARAAAQRALELDPTLAEPHATLAFVNMYYDWNWPAAERNFQLALQRDSKYATAHEWYGLFLAAMGRFPEANAEVRRAQDLDPLSVAISGTAAWVLHYSGRNEEAERILRVALRDDSTFALGHFYLGRIHQYRGDYANALKEFEAVGPLRTWVPTIAGIGNVYGMQQRTADARAILLKMDSLAHSEYVTAYGYALIHASLGERDSAFAWLVRAEQERTHWLVWLNRDFRWRDLRSDPRFVALTRRLRLPD
jgi:DNA-binding SARP family transcriptional activator/Tfp pilus assembly protein PilF